MMARLFVADDHQLFLSGLCSLLESVPNFEVVGSCHDGLTAVNLVGQLKPDVVLLDVSMPGLNGIDATIEILESDPSAKVIVVSIHTDRRFVLRALKAGARGYIRKDASFEDLREAVQNVLDGGIALSQEISSAVIEEYLKLANHQDKSPYTILTHREREVLQLIAEGRTTKLIASQLCLSVKTIESHRRNLMDKLDLHSVAEITLYAVREGLVSIT